MNPPVEEYPLNKQRNNLVNFLPNKHISRVSLCTIIKYTFIPALLSFIRMLILPQLSLSFCLVNTKNTAMTTPQPSCPNSYPNIRTNSNPFAYSTSETQHHPSSSQPIHDRNILFLHRLISALLLTFILIITISIISWLILHPHVPDVRVDSLSITNFNLSSSQLTASYEVKFTVRNLNRKINLEIESLKVSVLYKRNRLSRGRVQPFDVRKMKQTVLRVELGTNHSSNGFPVRKERVAAEMGREWRELGVVSLKLRMGGLVKFKAAKWLTKQSSVDVFCDNLVVGFSPGNNDLTGKASTTSGKDCSVYLL